MKKIIGYGCGLILGCLPLTSFATWQIADPYHGTKMHKSILPDRITTSDLPKEYTDKKCSASLEKGLLKDNIERTAHEYHWSVRWNAREDYSLLLETKLTGPSFPSVMDRLLSHYPLKAKYNRYSKVMTVSPASTPIKTHAKRKKGAKIKD